MSLDTLSDVLRGVRLRGAVFFSLSSQGDWAAEAPPAREVAPMLMPGVEHVIEYHALSHGSCWCGIPGEPAVRMSAGDVVLFPHGDGHVVSSAPGMRGEPNVGGLNEVRIDQLPLQVTYRGPVMSFAGSPLPDAEATVICGFLASDVQPLNPLLASLPRMLHLRASDDHAWVSSFSQQAVAESHARRPGGEAMLARMSEMMFVNAVRRYAESLPAQSAGWLAGLRDRFVGRALGL